MTAAVALGGAEIESITTDVWTSYLDVEGTRPLLAGEPGWLQDGVVTSSSSVSISGAWQGHVLIECSTACARMVTAALLAMAESEASDEDVADAVGELVNMVGGNVKSLVPGPSVLSLPHVITNAPARHGWPGAHLIARFDGCWDGEPFSVTVWEGRQS